MKDYEILAYKKARFDGEFIPRDEEYPNRYLYKDNGFGYSSIILYDEDIRDRYIDYYHKTFDFVWDGVYLMYMGQVNQQRYPNFTGTLIVISLSHDENCPEEVYYTEIERYDGEWKHGVLMKGTYSSSCGPYQVNTAYINSPQYEFFINGIMYALDNPGKRSVSLQVHYTGPFNKDRLFHGNDGELKLTYQEDYIRRNYSEFGEIVFKGKFEDGSITYGNYEGPYIGYSDLSSKYAKYRGTFLHGIPHENGKVQYNLGGGHYSHERMECEYSGEFLKGLPFGLKGIDKIFDKDFNVYIYLKGCAYVIKRTDERPYLEDVKEICFTGNDIFGFNPEIVSSNKVTFEGSLNHRTPTDVIYIPEDLHRIFGQGNLYVLTKGLANRIYKNYDDEINLNGTYRYDSGKIILDGIFICLDESNQKVFYEKWRCGFLIESSAAPFDNVELDITKIGNILADELLDGSKDSFKRMLSTILASKMIDGKMFVMYIIIGVLSTLVKTGKNILLNNYVIGNKEGLARAVLAGIHSLKGEMKEMDIELTRNQEETLRTTDWHYITGRRLNDFLERQDREIIKSRLEYTKKLFERTDQYFRDILALMEGEGYKAVSSLGMSVDNLARDYSKVIELFDELEELDINEIQDKDVALLDTKIDIFKDTYFGLFQIIEEALAASRIMCK